MGIIGIDKPELHIILMPPKLCEQLWEQIVPLLLKGEDSWIAYADLNDIKDYVLSEAMQLWLMVNAKTEKFEAILLTELTTFPKKKVLRFVHVSGENVIDNLFAKMDTIIEWGKYNEASACEIYGSPAWGRLLKQHGGFSERMVLYRDLGD